MKDLEQILQDSGIIIQPYWRSLFTHSAAYVKNHGMHPGYGHDFYRVWLEQGGMTSAYRGGAAAPLSARWLIFSDPNQTGRAEC